MWGNSPEVSSPRYFWTSDVISTVFLWKKVLNDVIILKYDLVKVSLLGISGYRLGHLEVSSVLEDELKLYIGTLISMS